MELPQKIICKRYLGIDDAFYDEMSAAAAQLKNDALAKALLAHAQNSMLEQRNLQQTHALCTALQTHTASFVPDAQHMVLAVLLAYSLPHALERLRAEGVDEPVLEDTFSDFATWAQHYEARTGVRGIGELPWMLYAYTGRLFKLGRLMFETQFFPFAWYGFAVKGKPLPVLLPPEQAAAFRGGDLVFGPGSPIVNIHIPARGAMDAQAVEASFSQARSFFAARKYPSRVGICESWLLDEALASFLPESSNIVQFMRRYEKFPLPAAHSSAASYVFGQIPVGSLQQAPEQTSLQRAMKQYLLGGGVLADTGGALWL